MRVAEAVAIRAGSPRTAVEKVEYPSSSRLMASTSAESSADVGSEGAGKPGARAK
jgi:hypothetical protein